MSGVPGTGVAVMAFNIGQERASTIMKMCRVMAALLRNVIVRRKLAVLNGRIGVNLEYVIMGFKKVGGRANDIMEQLLAMMRLKYNHVPSKLVKVILHPDRSYSYRSYYRP